jgi:hypothetical protein
VDHGIHLSHCIDLIRDTARLPKIRQITYHGESPLFQKILQRRHAALGARMNSNLMPLGQENPGRRQPQTVRRSRDKNVCHLNLILQRMIRKSDAAPHLRRRAVVEAKPFFGCFT